MIRCERYDLSFSKKTVRYLKGATYPIVKVTFLPDTPSDGDPQPGRAALLDSGSPVSLMSYKLIKELDLPWSGKFPKEIQAAGEIVTDKYRGSMVLAGETIRGIEFGVWGEEKYSLLGTDVFPKFLVAFDQQRNRVFLGRQSDVTTTWIIRALATLSRLGRAEASIPNEHTED